MKQSTLYRLYIALLTAVLLLTVLVTQVEIRMFRASLEKNHVLYERSQRELFRQKQINAHMERWRGDTARKPSKYHGPINDQWPVGWSRQ